MPFITEIVQHINEVLKAGSLKKVQPAKLNLISTVVGRTKPREAMEILPAIIEGDKTTLLIPDSKHSLQLYHKQDSNTYAIVPASYGNSHEIKSTTEMSMVVTTNAKIAGLTAQKAEPAIVFGLPQRISDALKAELKVIKVLITPLGSIMDQVRVFSGEFPKSQYFLDKEMQMFIVRYRIEVQFNQACVDACLCKDS
jgi:hypothetical protein